MKPIDNKEGASAFHKKGIAKLDSKDYSGAISDFTKAVEIDSKYTAAYKDRGWAQLNLNDYSGAIEDYTKAIVLDQNDAQSYHRRGTSLWFLKDYPGAIADYDKAIEIDAKYFSPYYNRGAWKCLFNDHSGAIEDYSKAIEIDPKYALAYYYRGQSKYFLEDYSGAIDDFSEVIDIDPANSLAHIERGKAKEKINYLSLGVGDYYGAMEDYTLAIGLDTENADSYRLRASTFITTKLDHSAAIADYDKAIELSPKFAYTYFARGASKSELNDHSGALADFSKAIELDPELASAPYYKTFLNKSELSDDSNTVVDINESTEESQEKVIATEDVNFKTTTLVTKTHNINWVDVMSKDSTGSVKSSPLVAYDGAELLLKDFQLKNSVNVPAWFEDEDGDVYLLFKSNTEADAKTLINRIINENGGMEKFTEVSPGGSWVYTFRADEFVIGYLAQHEVVRLNKIRPQPPEIIKEESEEDNTTELPDTINEIIQLIKSNPQAKIKIESSEWIDGSFQLSDDVESDSIEISDDEDGYDDFNVRKQKYSGRYYTWAQGIIENKSFLKCLNEFVKDEDIDPDEADIYDFYQYCQDYEIYTQDPESIKDNFEVKEYSEGTGRVFGLNEFSWYSVDYTRDADVEIKLLTQN